MAGYGFVLQIPTCFPRMTLPCREENLIRIEDAQRVQAQMVRYATLVRIVPSEAPPLRIAIGVREVGGLRRSLNVIIFAWITFEGQKQWK